MQITRDGKVYELTDEELTSAAEELAAIRKKEQQAAEEEQHHKNREWNAFRDCEAKTLPYPQNVLLSELYFLPEGELFLTGTDEYKEDILKGLLWAIGTLPEENRLAIEYRFRDHMKYREAGVLLNCTASKFSTIRSKSIKLLREPHRYKAYMYGYKRGVEDRAI